MAILERLQSEIEGDDAAHQKSMQEKDEMIERVSQEYQFIQCSLASLYYI